MGIRNIAATAHDMGIKSHLDETPSLALGSSDVNLLEMVDAYCCVADNGRHIDPVLVTRVVDQNGNEVYLAPTETKQVIPQKSAFYMQQLMMGGLREPGATSMSLNHWVGNKAALDTEFGGKTGTSNNHSDAWFICISPNLVCGAWVGGEYRCIHFRTGALGQGSKTALPICGYFLESVMNDPAFKSYHGKFTPPDEPIDRNTYIGGSYYHKPDTAAVDSTLEDENGEAIKSEETKPVAEGEPVITVE